MCPQVTTQLAAKADAANVYTKTDVYTKTEMDRTIGTPITSYKSAFKGPTPTTGWSYHYNRNGVFVRCSSCVTLRVWLA